MEQKKAPLSGEQRLALRMLEDALEKYKNYAGHPDSWAFKEVQAWIWSDDTEYSHSFLNICQMFNYEPDRIRRNLQRITMPRVKLTLVASHR